MSYLSVRLNVLYHYSNPVAHSFYQIAKLNSNNERRSPNSALYLMTAQTKPVMWRHANANQWHFYVIFVDFSFIRKLLQNVYSLVDIASEYVFLTFRYSLGGENDVKMNYLR